MSRVDEFRCFVGGLSWSTDDQALESNFRQFGRILDAKVIIDRASGRSRGFGFVTFAEQRAMDDAIDRLHNKELDGRVVTVNKAMPKIDTGGGASAGFGDRDRDRDRDRDYDRDRDRYRDREYASGYSNGGGRDSGSRDDTCFRCGRPGHWARDCPVTSSRDRYGGGSLSRPDRELGGRDFGFGRYGDRGGGGGGVDYYGDRYDRYSSGGDDYGRERRYDGGFRDRERGSGGAVRYDGGYRDRPGPYDRAPHFERSGPPAAYDRPRIRGPRSYDRY